MLIDTKMNDIYCCVTDGPDTGLTMCIIIIIVRITYDLMNTGSSEDAENLIQNMQMLRAGSSLGQAC